MTTTRPLTPLERAIMRAVVELHQFSDTSTSSIQSKTGIASSTLKANLKRLENMGVLSSTLSWDVKSRCHGYWRTYWWPAFDLTEVLKDG